jgi:chromate transporter
VGGGASTLFLMRRELVERRRWLSARDFLEDWALCKLSPGINLIALTALVGTRLAGTRGLVVSVLAMLLPAGVITAAMTAGYGEARDHPLVVAALAGAGPVSAGMAGGVAIVFARQAVRRGWHAAADWTYMGLAVAAGLFTGVHTLALIAIGLAVGGLFLRGETTRASGDPGT